VHGVKVLVEEEGHKYAVAPKADRATFTQRQGFCPPQHQPPRKGPEAPSTVVLVAARAVFGGVLAVLMQTAGQRRSRLEDGAQEMLGNGGFL
jgi:hypothetical protein